MSENSLATPEDVQPGDHVIGRRAHEGFLLTVEFTVASVQNGILFNEQKTGIGFAAYTWERVER